MKAAKLQYDITDSLYGEGDIHSIHEEDGFWRSLVECSEICLKCSLKYQSQLLYIDVKVKDVDMIQFRGYQKDEKRYAEMKLFKDKDKNSEQNTIRHYMKEKTFISEILISFHMNTKKRCAINYVSLHGNIDYSKPNSLTIKNKKKARPEAEEIELYAQEKDIEIKPIMKQTKQFKIKPNQLLAQENFEDILKLKESQNNISQHFIQKIDKKKLKIFQGISENWLLSQKKMEFDNKIPTQYQLSVMIDSKCFRHQFFCLQNLSQPQRHLIMPKIKQLGGFIREQPCHDCYLVTSDMTGSIVGIAQLMNNIKFVVPKYIEDCYKSKSLLGIKIYRPK